MLEAAAELPPGGASLTTLGATGSGRDTVIKVMLRLLAEVYDRWHVAPAEVRHAYRSVCGTFGQTVEVHHRAGSSTGQCCRGRRCGRLLVDRVAHAAGTSYMSDKPLTHR